MSAYQTTSHTFTRFIKLNFNDRCSMILILFPVNRVLLFNKQRMISNLRLFFFFLLVDNVILLIFQKSFQISTNTPYEIVSKIFKMFKKTLFSIIFFQVEGWEIWPRTLQVEHDGVQRRQVHFRLHFSLGRRLQRSLQSWSGFN